MTTPVKSCEAFAPATVANVSVGYDNLGFALNTIGDRVRVTRTDDKEVTISSIAYESYLDESNVGTLPTDPLQNTASIGLLKFIKEQRLSFGFDLEITKGIPIGSGLGGSAASSVAAIVAANGLLQNPLEKKDLLVYALEGEALATGAHHADNVGPCLFGGMTLTPAGSDSIVHIPFPKIIKVASVFP